MIVECLHKKYICIPNTGNLKLLEAYKTKHTREGLELYAEPRRKLVDNYHRNVQYSLHLREITYANLRRAGFPQTVLDASLLRHKRHLLYLGQSYEDKREEIAQKEYRCMNRHNVILQEWLHDSAKCSSIARHWKTMYQSQYLKR